MFIIDFRNKNMSEYRFSVINNSNVDVVNLYSNFVQYATNTSIYLKIRSVDDTYVDKIAIASENISIDDGALLCKWRMGAVSTHCKKIGLQLQFEQEGDIIAQTGIVYLTLADTIDVDELMPIIYPQILKELQEQIDALTDDSGAKVTLGYSNDVFTINLLNVNNEIIDTKTIAIPTNKAFVNVAFANRVITFTANDGSTKQVNLSDIYTKEEVNNLLANKVDKVSQANKVYATDGNGGQTALPVDDYAGNVARRDANNQVVVPATPTENGHATSKSYVDGLIAGIKMDSYKVVDTTTYPTLNDFLASTGEEGYLYLYPIDTSDLSKGYYRYVWENNAWLSLGTTEIDLSNYPTLNGNNTFGGVNDFSGATTFSGRIANDLKPHTTGNRDLGSSAYTWRDLYLSGNANIGGNLQFSATAYFYGSAPYVLSFYGNLRPTADNQFNIGSSDKRVQSVYIASNLSDGTYSVTVGSVYKTIFNRYYTDNSKTTLNYDEVAVISLSADRTFTFQTAPTGCYPEYKAIITNSGSSAITLTFNGVTNILTNDDNCVVNANTITIPSGVTIEVSVINEKMVAINFNA